MLLPRGQLGDIRRMPANLNIRQLNEYVKKTSEFNWLYVTS